MIFKYVGRAGDLVTALLHHATGELAATNKLNRDTFPQYFK